MVGKALFLSHITEERELAVLIKGAIENEFGGFVDVFVSSDGISIPAGSNFLKRITESLINCVGAIYLISPMSVRRPWINFELGAVWIRSAISEAGGDVEIPALPFCHSGMVLSSLPPPIGSLNAIIANEASQLRFAFASLQKSVGGKGPLRTNFDELASGIKNFEAKYTIMRFVREFLQVIGASQSQLIAVCQDNPSVETLDLGRVHVAQRDYDKLEDLVKGPLAGIAELQFVGLRSVAGSAGGISGPVVQIWLKTSAIMRLVE